MFLFFREISVWGSIFSSGRGGDDRSNAVGRLQVARAWAGDVVTVAARS